MLPARNNVILSENSWEDIVNKYKLYRDLEIVIRDTDSSDTNNSVKASRSGKTRVIKNNAKVSWTYRTALAASIFAFFGNIPVQSHLLEHATDSQIFSVSNIIQENTLNPKKNQDDIQKELIAATSDASNPASLELTLPKHAIETYVGHTIKVASSKWKTYHVKSYDNLTNIFHKIGYQEVLNELKKSEDTYKELKALNKYGTIVRASSNDNGQLSKLVFTNDKRNSFVISLTSDKNYSSQWKKKVFEIRQARASFTIKNGLFFDGKRAGLENKIIQEIVKVFDWDIDFSHDIRVGDKVTAVFEELYHDGDKVGSKDLLAAEFINKKRVLRTVRYTFSDGKSDYFTPDGREMKKAFIRTPIPHARVSSNFNPGRFHPVLHRIKAHKGTDFAARRGTPIMATGNGTVKFIGRKGGYGNMIIIAHREGYTTRYGHMSRFKKGLKKGDKVYQSDIIGYVGSTGLATGPHLHYEIRKNNNPMDPMRASLPNSMSLSSRELQDFRNKAINLVLQLNVLHRFVEANIEIDSAIGG